LSDALPDRLKKSKNGREFVEDIVNSAFNRSPRRNGKWTGERGNSYWIKDDPDFLKATNGKGVEFRDNFPDFSPFSKGEKKFDNLTGDREVDKGLYAKEMVKDGRAGTETEAKAILSRDKIELHHDIDLKTLQEIPAEVHSIPHLGGSSIIKKIRRLPTNDSDD
jgi:hypothetical protein